MIYVVKTRLVLERETPGALRYQEVTPAGLPLTQKDLRCLLGTQYIRKEAFHQQLRAQSYPFHGWPRDINAELRIVSL